MSLTHYTGIISAKTFQKMYNDLANSPDKRPIASTILPFLGANGFSTTDNTDGQPLVYGWIFYEQLKPSQETPKEPEKKKVMMEM